MDTQVTSETINTTMGDLIEAITKVALEASKSQEEAYQLVSLVVQDLLRKNRKINSAFCK